MDPRFSTDSAVPTTVLYQPPSRLQAHPRPAIALSPKPSLSSRGQHSRAMSKDSAAFGKTNLGTDATTPTTGQRESLKPADTNGIGIAIGGGNGTSNLNRTGTRTRTKRSNTERLVPALKTSFERNAGTMGSPSTPLLPSASSSRGAKFTVGNVSHGRLFLRPAVRPAHELHQFVLPPSTPPNSAEDEEKEKEKAPGWFGKSKLEISDTGSTEIARLDGSTDEPRLPLTPPPKTPPQEAQETAPLESSPPVAQQPRHNRARSFSIQSKEQRSIHSPEPSTFRVTIDRAEPERPKTAGPDQPYPGLNVNIPGYAIGSPRFSPLGTPFMHSSMMEGSSLHIPSTWGERGSAATSQRNSEFHWLAPQNSTQSKEDRKEREQTIHTPYLSPPDSPHNMPSSFLFPPTPVMEPAPEIFDALSFPPESEDPSVVKYDPNNKEIIAATPARIIAQITSATFLDYQLLSDFFLTFRLFLSPPDLVAFLIARLHWAIERDDVVGRVVRVRTFVAIRHWLLNYFADDFVPSVHLREAFVERLNDLSHMVAAKGSQSDLKIIGEIKRCWRRTCALYWDRNAERHGSVVSDSIETDITPGGDPGDRKDLKESYFPKVVTREEKEFMSEVAPSVGGSAKGKGKMKPSDSNSWPRRGKRSRPALPQMDGNAVSNGSQSPVKVQSRMGSSNGGEGPSGQSRTKSHTSKADAESTRAASYSVPTLSTKRNSPSTSPFASGFKFPLENTEAIQSAPGSPYASSQALSRKIHAHPSSHKRSGSFSDALRDTRTPLPAPGPASKSAIARSTHLLMAFPYASSLVRGNLLPPTAAFVEVLAPSTPSNDSRKSSPISANAKQSPIMKKWLRKVLGGKQSGVNAQMHVRTSSPPVPFGRYSSPAGSDSSPLTPIAREAPRIRFPVGREGLTRIDLLGAGVVESFQRAVQEEGRRWDDPMGAVVDATMDEALEDGQEGERRDSAVQSRQETEGGERTPLKAEGMEWTRLSKESLVPEKKPEVGSPEHVAGLRDFEQRMRLSTPTPSISEISMSKAAIEASTPAPTRKPVGGRCDPEPGFADTQDLPPPRQPTPSIRSLDERSLHTTRSINTLGTTATKQTRRFSDSSIIIADEGFEYTSDLSSPAFNRSRNEPFDRPPNRMLRRRPGGNLKIANNVTELETTIDRSQVRSAGSSSLAGSFVSFLPAPRIMSPLTLPQTAEEDRDECTVEEPDDELPAAAQGMLSLGALANAPPRAPTPLQRSSSLGSGSRGSRAPSHEPRNSFEAGVAKLALLADNSSEDGGVEVALLKLEGRYERESKMSPMKEYFERTFFGGEKRLSELMGLSGEYELEEDGEVTVMQPTTAEEQRSSDSYEEHLLRMRHRHKQILENQPLDTPPVLDSQEGSYFGVGDESGSTVEVDKPAQLRRGYSDSSVPVARQSSLVSSLSTPRHGPSSNFHHSTQRNLAAEISGHLETANTTAELTPENSDDVLRDDISELSSDMDFSLIDGQMTARNSAGTGKHNMETFFAGLDIPSHPLRHPPSPPLTLKQALHMNIDDDDDFLLPLQMTASTAQRPGPSPSATSNSITRHAAIANAAADMSQIPDLVAPPLIYEPTPVHLPFILAYDSELLAKQFTLIEKDALAEVDWKELVELRWKNAGGEVQDWVEFLSQAEVRGVEVVIARFNLVWKWAMSEIVLTASPTERARTIIKLIHIAAHSRRLQNYATMYQITASLLSTNIARLKRTWALISPADMATFHSLEALVQPVRNFHNLRVEMDRVRADEGVIPFCGLFTHDLIYNAQRPSYIAAGPSRNPKMKGQMGGMLVNFEKHRMTAAIVKRLLRLVESSQRYGFKAVDGVCERCLWISCLSDEEIEGLSRGLEE